MITGETGQWGFHPSWGSWIRVAYADIVPHVCEVLNVLSDGLWVKPRHGDRRTHFVAFRQVTYLVVLTDEDVRALPAPGAAP